MKVKAGKETRALVFFGILVCMAFLTLGFAQSTISPRLRQKMHNAVKSTFEVTEFQLIPLSVNDRLNEKTAIELGKENLYKINEDQKVIGYAYLGQAPSMKNSFDYLVLFNPDMGIRKSKVLIYREDYGRQIGSQRWLKQFIGKKMGDSLLYGEDVDAISGATISAKSMTKAVEDVLKSMVILKKEKIL
ncbi:MAG: FMN-binding protein [Bacteroidota bacterium]